MSIKDVKPLSNRVLVKRSSSVTTKKGIILPESAQEKPKKGEVVAVGPGKMDDKGNTKQMNVKVGDEVLFTSYAGVEVKSDEPESEYLIMSEEDILGVLVS